MFITEIMDFFYLHEPVSNQWEVLGTRPRSKFFHVYGIFGNSAKMLEMINCHNPLGVGAPLEILNLPLVPSYSIETS